MALGNCLDIVGLVLLGGYYEPTLRADVVAFSGPAIAVLGDIFRYTIAPALAASACQGEGKPDGCCRVGWPHGSSQRAGAGPGGGQGCDGGDF